jgi:hypothetical protein
LRCQQGELHLQALQGYPLIVQPLVQLSQSFGSHIRDPQALHGSTAHQICKTIQQRPFLPGGVAGRAPVQLHPFHLALQPLLRSGEGAGIAIAAEAPREGGEFGGDA